MLVLSRKSNQSLIIDHEVTVTVVEIGEDFVRLAVAAPNEADVRRRYPQALDVERVDPGRPVVVTLTLHHAAVLDRMRRQMSDDETVPPSRDEALGMLLDSVAENDDLSPARIAVRSIPR